MYGLDGAWFDSWRELIGYVGTPAEATPGGGRASWMSRANDLASERVIRNGKGRPISFVLSSPSAPSARDTAQAYELVVNESGEVPTRTQGEAAWHDYFNALMWLAWPQSKRVINQRQAQEISERGISGRRGPLRDALTLFDESAVLFICEQPSAIEDLRQHRWQKLFVERRNQFGSRLRCVVIGHALLQKLMRPYKSICGHALPLPIPLPAAASAKLSAQTAAVTPQNQPAEWASGRSCVSPVQRISATLDAQFGELDAMTAALLARQDFGKDRLTPLPVLGVPGWWPANAQPEFYNDPQVFRARAIRMRPVDTKETKA